MKFLISCITSLLYMMFVPTLIFISGYIGGLVFNFIFGKFVAETINLIFDSVSFSRSYIPAICGILSCVGGFLFPVNSNTVEIQGAEDNQQDD